MFGVQKTQAVGKDKNEKKLNFSPFFLNARV